MIPLRPVVRLFAVLCLAIVSPSALRADPLAHLPAGKPVVTQADFAPASDTSLVTLRSEGLGEREGASIWRADTADAAKQPWTAQLRAKFSDAVKKGDRGLILITARAVETSHESDQARLRLVVTNKEKPFPRIATGEFSVGRDWRTITLPFAFARDFKAEEIMATLDLGYGRQAVEFAGLRVINFGTTVELARLPRTRSTYLGHEPDAPWRRAALARIETLRKGDLALVVTDAAGRPVPDATVRVALASHAFQFGTAVNVETFTADSPDTETYRRHIPELFNAASLENGLKWGNWISEGKSADYRARTLQTLDWLKSRDLALRGHVMVWPGWRFLPGPIKALRGTPDEKRIPELTREHIRDIAVGTKNYITEWDVLNEPVSNHDLMDLFGNEIMIDWFKTAEAALPGVPLFLNDWGNHDQVASADHVRDFEAIALSLREQGAALGGLGLQCHIGGTLSAPQDILATLDRYQKTLGLPVRVTEFDVAIDDEEIQADYTRDFMIAMFSHPSVVGVQHWGFWAGRHWEPKAALYRKDWTEKPNGAAYRKLVKETWHTDASGRTDANGRWQTPGFFGRYMVRVTLGDKVHEIAVEHRPRSDATTAVDDGTLTVVLPVGFAAR